MAGRPRSGRGQGVRLDRWVKTDEINSNTDHTHRQLRKNYYPWLEATQTELPKTLDTTRSSTEDVG